MPANGFTVGKDVSLVITTPSGNLSLPVTTSGFEARPQYNKVRGVYMDGVNRGFNAPTGWEGTIKLDRSNKDIDVFFAQQEAGYYAGQNTFTATITETITEADGSISQWRYTNVLLSYDEAGSKTGDAKVPQTIGFFASKRLQVA